VVFLEMNFEQLSSTVFLFAQFTLSCRLVKTLDVVFQTCFMRKFFGAIVTTKDFCRDAMESHVMVENYFVDERLRAQFAFVRLITGMCCHMN
jgi:hypothetical protein